jgi:hypothetical protein
MTIVGITTFLRGKDVFIEQNVELSIKTVKIGFFKF